MSAADMAERHGRVLAELSELGLAMARDLQGRALAVGTVEEATALGLAFQRTARAVRQCLALEAKLERDRQAAQVTQAKAAETQARDATQRRRERIKLAVERRIWREADGLVAERLLDELDDLLAEISTHDDFLAGDIEALIGQACDDLGLTSPLDDEVGDEEVGGEEPGDEAPRNEAPQGGPATDAPGLDFDAAPPAPWPRRALDPG